MKTTKAKKICRFASSNSFLGFRSYFDQAFPSHAFDRIFVIKGGPGTGKSTLMKKCAALADALSADTEKIFCSSDPKSLDGVIMRLSDHKVAILDGTAPHERDAVIPGAVDTLVNLGVTWNEELLTSHREEIIHLNRKKSEEYSHAYTELGFSFKYWSKIKAEYIKRIDKKRTSELSQGTSPYAVSSSDPNFGNRLISSFSRDGYSSVKLEDDLKVNFSICGNPISASILCTELARRAGVHQGLLLSPLDPDICEGFYGSDGIQFTIHDGGQKKIYSDDYFDLGDEAISRIKYFEENMRIHAERGAMHLSRASEHHFALEDIYTPCMNFEVIDKITEEILERIKNILLS